METDSARKHDCSDSAGGPSCDSASAAVRSAIRLYGWSLVPACVAMVLYGPMIYFLGEPFSANVYDSVDPDVAGMVSLGMSVFLLVPAAIAWFLLQRRFLPAGSSRVRVVSVVVGYVVGAFVAVTTLVTLSFVALLMYRGESAGTMPVWGIWWAISVASATLNVAASMRLRKMELRER